MTETLEFDDTGLDRWTDDERLEVTQDRLAEYAAATNDRSRRTAEGTLRHRFSRSFPFSRPCSPRRST